MLVKVVPLCVPRVRSKFTGVSCRVVFVRMGVVKSSSYEEHPTERQVIRRMKIGSPVTYT